ncbi:MAG TPA: hypothetical protein VKU02_04615, partial [Gemmataceae bacterium]|nr:hypothetical protein [Gemmataceae bacterium]
MFRAKYSFLFLACLSLLSCTSALQAALPTDPAVKAELVGQPVSLRVQPEAITLNGPRDGQQIIVTGCYADGSVRDLTPFSEIELEAGNVSQSEGGGYL